MQRLPCSHTGTYADDCLCERVQQHKCYIVATCDRDLRRRIRKVQAQHACLASLVCSPLRHLSPADPRRANNVSGAAPLHHRAAARSHYGWGA